MHTKAQSCQQILCKVRLFVTENDCISKNIRSNLCFELEIVHQILIKFKNPDRSDRVGKQLLEAAMVVSCMTARANGTLCLLFSG